VCQPVIIGIDGARAGRLTLQGFPLSLGASTVGMLVFSHLGSFHEVAVLFHDLNATVDFSCPALVLELNVVTLD
jgi:hypothetical protein